MKLDFQAKFLQHLNQKKQQDEGFTLIELLVVIIIIGILAAIALPSLLGQVNKAKQSEAKNNVGALNRAQQAYMLEYSEFATGLTQLGVGIKSQTVNYLYSIDSSTAVLINQGTAIKSALKSYAGLVATVTGDTTTGEVLTVAAACESVNPTTTAFPTGVTPTNVNSTEPCVPATDWKNLGR
jgi:type IV pilus assembly protein PilA